MFVIQVRSEQRSVTVPKAREVNLQQGFWGQLGWKLGRIWPILHTPSKLPILPANLTPR